MNFFTYQFESAEQFYEELADILDGGGYYDSSESRIGFFISLIGKYHDEYMDPAGQDLTQCCYRLLDSEVFKQHTEAIISSIIDQAIESTSDDDLWVIYTLLYLAGKELPKVNHWMFKPEFFGKLRNQTLEKDGSRIQPLVVSLLYEMCRIHTLQADLLYLVDDTLLNHLLDIVEQTRDDNAENFNYSTIKLLLVFNEQFMLGMSRNGAYSQKGVKLEYSGNPLLSVLSDRTGLSCTFGENLIFMLNRAEETALQMLILKLLYVLFTSPSLYDFFYTNDLHVLVDVVIRELWDLPEEEESLRHAYLRVLGPLLVNTQLKNATYKRAELVRLLRDLGGGDLDSTLRYQLQEQQRKEHLLELERAHHAKFTYRDRQSSTGTVNRWASDRSGCSSPVLSSDVEKNRPGTSQSKLSINSTSSSLQVPGADSDPTDISSATIAQSPDECKDIIFEVSPLAVKEPVLRVSSPTTLRLVERVLREWLDTELKDGGGTTGAGLSVRGVTDGQMNKA